MQEPARIAFRNMTAPIGLEDEIQGHIAELEKFFNHIVTCHVTVETDHRRHRQGNLYRVRIVLVVPHHDIVVRREPPERHEHEDLRLAVRDAFHATRRQLQDYVRSQQGAIKEHAPPTIGTIGQVFPDHAFVVTATGEEVYAHRNAVLGRGFDRLNTGDKVRYVVQDSDSDEGPHASTVIPL